MEDGNKPIDPEDKSWIDKYPENVQKVLRRTPEEDIARTHEVMRESGILMVENFYQAGFYSKQELNTITWQMLQDPNYSEEQRQRLQSLRNKALSSPGGC